MFESLSFQIWGSHSKVDHNFLFFLGIVTLKMLILHENALFGSPFGIILEIRSVSGSRLWILFSADQILTNSDWLVACIFMSSNLRQVRKTGPKLYLVRSLGCVLVLQNWRKFAISFRRLKWIQELVFTLISVWQNDWIILQKHLVFDFISRKLLWVSRSAWITQFDVFLVWGTVADYWLVRFPLFYLQASWANISNFNMKNSHCFLVRRLQASGLVYAVLSSAVKDFGKMSKMRFIGRVWHSRT